MILYFEPANRISGNRIHRYALLSVTLATEPMCMHCLVTNVDVILAVDILAVWRLSGSVLSRCFLAPLGVLFVMKTLEDER